MLDEPGAKGPNSLFGEPEATPSSREKGTQAGGEEKTLEQRFEEAQKENERKAQVIEEMKEKVQMLLDDKEERLAELRDKGQLTDADRREVVDLESQIAKIKSYEPAKPWLELGRRQSREETREALREYDAMITERAVRKMAKQDNVPFEKFEREIVRYMAAVDPEARMPGSVRAELAWERMQADKDFARREEELRRKEAQFMESTGKQTQKSKTREEIMKEAITSDRGLESALAGISAAQDESTRK